MALADLHDLVYFHNADNLYVNLFVPSTVTWNRADARVTIRQRTRFPESDVTELTMVMERPANFSLKLRVPGWLAGPLGIVINGETIVAALDTHGWAGVHRQWRDGDRVTVHLPTKVVTRPLDSSSPFPAFLMRGPVALAVRSTAKNPGAFLRTAELERVLVSSPGEPLTYHIRSDQDLLIRPFYAFQQGESYSVCLDPNRFSHERARFAGENWRESESFRFNNQPGASITFEFVGTGVRWIGFRFDDAGTADVRIDGKPIAKVDQYGPQRNSPFEWRKDGLPVGSHRLTLTILESKPGPSKDRFINVAGFEVVP